MDRLGIECMECHSAGTVVHMAVDGKYAGHILILSLIHICYGHRSVECDTGVVCEEAVRKAAGS